MSRSINESVNQLKTSLSDIKTSLSNKNIEGGEQLKVSEVAGLIDQIQVGGGGVDWDNPKYMTITPKQTFHTYDVLDSIGYENEIHVRFDPKDKDFGTFIIFTHSIDFKVTNENSEYPNNWNEEKEIYASEAFQKKIKFRGCGNRPVFLIVFASDEEIYDIAKIDVRST